MEHCVAVFAPADCDEQAITFFDHREVQNSARDGTPEFSFEGFGRRLRHANENS
jgi:hypothetical protein